MSHNLSDLSPETLLGDLKARAARSFAQMADLLAVLGEVDRRELWADKAYGSLFAYCVGELNWSEGEAAKKIQASRAGRRFPLLLKRLGEGRLHLCGLVLLAPKLTRQNAGELIDAAGGLSKRKLELLLATRFPRPDVAPSIRKLPKPRSDRSGTKTAVAPATVAATIGSASPATTPTPPPTPPPSTANTPSLVLHGPKDRGAVEPLAAERHRLTATISGETRARIERISALLSHRGADKRALESVLDQALELLEAKLMKERFGVGAKPQRKRRTRPAADRPEAARADRPEAAEADRPEAAEAGEPRAAVGTETRPVESPCPPPAGVPTTTGSPTSRAFSMADRRAIVARDGLSCSFVDPDMGARCGETRWLTFDHVVPWARGGPTSAGNGRLLCGPHNRQQARRSYGEAFVRERMEGGARA